MAEVHEGTALPLRLHNLLLALAGRLDDSALSHARGLAVKARADEAVELIAGSLIAGRLPLRESEHRELTGILTLSGSEPAFADQVTINDAEVDKAEEHRFSGHDAPEDGIVPALERVSHVLPGLRSVRAVWRNSTAGRVPGPMPQRVVLIEMGSGGSAPATAHRVQAALRHAGISASVEVSAPSSEWTPYHERALASAVTVWSATASVRRAPATERQGRSAATHSASAEQATQDTGESDPAEPASPQQTAGEPNFDAAPSREHAIGAQGTREIPVPEPARQPEPEPEQAKTSYPPPAQSAVAAFTELNVDPFSTHEESAGHAIEPAGGASPADKWEHPVGTDLVPGEMFWPQADAQATQQSTQRTGRNGHSAAAPQAPEAAPEPGRAGPETPAERTTEMTSQEVTQLQDALRDVPENTTASDANVVHLPPVEPPANPQSKTELSDRDRELLRELHAELAKREREQAAQVRLNGWEHPG